MTNLEAVNYILACVGESPLLTLDGNHPQQQAALNAITTASKRLQSKGWWFNTFCDINFPQDMDGRVPVPTTVLSIDPHSRYMNLVQRDGFLYDLEAQTNVLNEDVRCNFIDFVPFEDLPETAAQYVTDLARIQFFSDFDGDTEKLRRLSLQATDPQIGSITPFKAEHIRNSDVNLYQSGETAYNLYRIRGERYWVRDN